MDWSNEYWVRAYVKDSPSFSMCSWAARALFFLIERKVNADGVLMLEPGDPVTSAMYISGQLKAPWDEISGPIIELIKTGTIEIPADWSRLRIPNFRKAQSAVWTDSFRMKTMRQRRKETARGTGENFVPADPETIIRDLPVAVSPTIPYMPTGEELRDAEEANRSLGSGEVVNGTFVPRTLPPSPVTPRNAVLNASTARVTPRNEMFDTDQKDLSDPSDHSRRPRQLLSGEGLEQESPAEAEREEAKPLTQTSSRLVTDNPQLALIPGEEPTPDPDAVSRQEISIVWDHYIQRWQSLRDKKRFGGLEPKMSKKTRAHICARIREFGVDNVVRAIDKLFNNPWRTDSGYFGIQYVVRSSEQFQMLMMRNDALDVGQGGRRGTADQPLQGAPKKTYVGRGVQTGPDGRVYDHRGNVVEIDDALPVDFGLPRMRA